MKSVSITPGKNNVGAYINDVNLNKLNNDLTGQIKDILNNYGVIFIKKQNLDPNAYQNFAKSIGQLVEYPRLKGLENFPYINVLERKPSDKSLAFGGSWLHQDTSYLEKDRPRYTMLMGIEIPVGQGNTIFPLVLMRIKIFQMKLNKKLKMLKVFFHLPDRLVKLDLNWKKELELILQKFWKLNIQLFKRLMDKNLYMFLRVI